MTERPKRVFSEDEIRKNARKAIDRVVCNCSECSKLREISERILKACNGD